MPLTDVVPLAHFVCRRHRFVHVSSPQRGVPRLPAGPVRSAASLPQPDDPEQATTATATATPVNVADLADLA
jgi:hypothetical protein